MKFMTAVLRSWVLAALLVLAGCQTRVGTLTPGFPPANSDRRRR